MLIGLAGQAGSGKDTVGVFLSMCRSFERFAFADLLKDKIGKGVFNFGDSQLWGNYKEVIDPRYQKTPREILQVAGMALRECFKDIWILPLYEFVNQHERVVVTDVRLLNEIEAIKELGGQVWLIEREESGSKVNPEHISEKEFLSYDAYDAKIMNNGSLADLFEKVNRLLEVNDVQTILRT